MTSALPPPPSYSASNSVLATPGDPQIQTFQPNQNQTNQPNDNQPNQYQNQPNQSNQYKNEALIRINSISTDNTINDNQQELDKQNTIVTDSDNDMKLSLEAAKSGQLPFNTFYEDLPFVHLSPYSYGIPSGLEGLKRRLILSSGLEYEGIFRLRGREINLNNALSQLNLLSSICAINVTPIEVAQLIKGWYRNLPCDEPGYLPHQLLNCSTSTYNSADIINIFNNGILTEPRKSLLLWTFDLWIKIEEYKPKNKMTLQSMSIVFSPNMIRSNDPNPIKFLELQKKCQNIIYDAAKLRKEGKLIQKNSININHIDKIVPFKINRNDFKNNNNDNIPKYAPYIPNNNNNNNNSLSDFLKSCIIL